MRITEQSYINNFLQNINRNRSEMARLEEQLATEKRVNKPSDDPIAFADGRDIEAEIGKNEQYQANIDAGLNQATAASTAVSQMLDNLTQLKTIVTKGANGGTLSQDELNTLADNIDQLKQSFVELGNTQIQGRYIFAGTKSGDPPFSIATDGTVNYSGNSEDLTIRISDSTTVNVSKNGNTINDYKSGDTLFDLFDRIEADLRSGDTQAVNDEMDNVDDAVSHVSDMGSSLGNTINQMQFTNQQYETSNINLKSNVSNLTDADFASVISQFQSLQTAYTAALSVHTQIMNNNLANYM